MSASVPHSYNHAIDALNSLQTPYDVIARKKKAGIKPGPEGIEEMKVYLRRAGYTTSDLNRLNIIHVAGTKGKGSTCAFVDSILSQYREARGTPCKNGLFISPHLIAVRERIRINSQPISESLFAKYFFEVWERLGNSTLDEDVVAANTRPIYARFLTLLSWHVFLQEGVNVAVYETGIGGEYDATNVIPRPLVCGIASLGIDHTYVLGDTIDSIAWHKAGIMKTGSPAFTVQQPVEALGVLEARAREKGVDLVKLPSDPRLDNVKIRPNAAFQKGNASLAVALATTALRQLKIDKIAKDQALPAEFVNGLEKATFRGRCEVLDEDRVTWHLDGAHTTDSLRVASQWFANEVSTRKTQPRVLIFNQQGRSEAVTFLNIVHDTIRDSLGAQSPFDHVIFCTNTARAATTNQRDLTNNTLDPKDLGALKAQHGFAKEWARLDPHCEIRVVQTFEHAVERVRKLSVDLTSDHKVQTFITGSLHLVGAALAVLEKADAL